MGLCVSRPHRPTLVLPSSPAAPLPPLAADNRPSPIPTQVRALRGVDGGGEPEVVTVSAVLEAEAQP